MKEIKAVIRPSKLHRIREAFRRLKGFPGMTIDKVHGCSGHEDEERHATLRGELTEFSDKVRIEIVAPDELVPEILRIIHENAYTGQPGDGVMWVAEVSEFRRLCRLSD
ncbi:MAG: P-II family nitrogen regulator [Pseudomonadota bacterium]|jgi:nitrogen regulatory protein P-II 1